jgi:hypothetical protein
MRRAFLVFACGIYAVSLVVCGCVSESAEFPGGHAGVWWLRGLAEARVQHQYPDAELFWIAGSAGGEGAMEAGDVTKWWFYFYEPTDESGSPHIVWLVHQDDEFSEIHRDTDVPISVNFEPLPDTMTIVAAVERLRTLGYDEPFHMIWFFKTPLSPMRDEACFCFEFADHPTVWIGAVSGKVLQAPEVTE